MSPKVVRVSAAPVPPSATQFMVPMRDGVRLATDVYLPADPSPTETIVVRLPYDKNSRYVFFEFAARRFADRGYAVVVQDVRGKFRSEGDTLAFVFEPADGYDTIDWVVAQEWSNGVVGMFGDSYYGFTQWAAVSSGHPALRAIVPRVTTAYLAGEPHRDGPVGEVQWLTAADYLCSNWLDHDRYELDLDWSVRPLRDVVEGAYREIGGRSMTLDFLIPSGHDATAPDGSGDVDDDGAPLDVYPHGHPFDGPPLPVLHCVGWFDNLAIASMRDFLVLRDTPGWAELQYLSADSVDHENYHLALTPITEADDHNVNAAALDRMLDLYTGPALDFFDVFVKRTRSVESLPRVRWHLGHEGYHESSTWPPANAQEQRLHLTALAGAADSATDGGVLSPQPVTAPESVQWVHDPAHLVPSAVDNSFSFLPGYPDEAHTTQRPDVLTFTAAPVVAPLDLAGPVDLWVSVTSKGPSTDVFAKLLDLAPDGTMHMIVRGQGRIRRPFETRLVQIELGHTGYRLRPGHRLCLAIASSDFPEFLPNTGTTESPWLAVHTVPTTQTLTTAPDCPAYLSISTLPGHA
jgi:putative CocE/NonD family hydrolase